MNLKELEKRTISPGTTILHALKKMDLIDKKLLIILEKQKFVGLLSVGDIQRAIINNTSLNISVKNIIRSSLKVAKPDESFESIKSFMLKNRVECMPVVDAEMNLTNVYFWEDFFQNIAADIPRKINLPVVIMAGGLGSRLKPLTNVLPKPLIPIGEKTIIEHIFDRFSKYGCDTFYISVNYKADLIEYYVRNLGLSYNLSFFKEDLPLGTAGSLSLLKGKISQTFFVNNCDILIEQDYADILDYHRDSRNEITIIAALKHYPIPYGTIESGENGMLINLTEKPELTFKINSGMYIIEPHLIDQIPDNQFFHITELIEKVKGRDGKVGVFPVSEKSWKDIGEGHLLKLYSNE